MKAVTALLAPLLLAGCAAPSTSSPAGPATALMRPDPLHGYDVADRNCSLCHAIRPAAAHLVTVFGSTRNSAATSPGVSRRSPVSTAPSSRRRSPRLNTLPPAGASPEPS